MADSAPASRGANRRPVNSHWLFTFSLLGRARCFSSQASKKIHRPCVLCWSEWWGSNPRPQRPERCTLPLRYTPKYPGTHDRTMRATRLRHSPWSGRQDLNLRPPRPKRGALPGCATPRNRGNYIRNQMYRPSDILRDF